MLLIEMKAEDKIIITNEDTGEEIILLKVSHRGKLTKLGIDADLKYKIVYKKFIQNPL